MHDRHNDQAKLNQARTLSGDMAAGSDARRCGGAGSNGDIGTMAPLRREHEAFQGAAHGADTSGTSALVGTPSPVMQGPISLNLDALAQRVHIIQAADGRQEVQENGVTPTAGQSQRFWQWRASGATPPALVGGASTSEPGRDAFSSSSPSGGQLIYLDNIILQKQDRIAHEAPTMHTSLESTGWVAEEAGSTRRLPRVAVGPSGQRQQPFQAGCLEQREQRDGQDSWAQDPQAVQKEARHLGTPHSAPRRHRGHHAHAPQGERGCGSTHEPSRQPPVKAQGRQQHQPHLQQRQCEQGAESGSNSNARENAVLSVPRPHPYYLRPQHVKTNYMCHTPDGWKLHLIRTRQLCTPSYRQHPVLLCPGLGSSGAYSFDLSPTISLADYLASRGWDVWTVELRGNGQSDKPSLGSSRSSTWTIDDYVEKDIPSLVRFILKEARPPGNQVHFLGHSMGGMILLGVMARMDTTAARVRSLTLVGSGLFLEDSRWRAFERFNPLLKLMWTVPSGRWLRWYGTFMLGPLSIPFLDELYFAPGNVDVGLARALMRRNFSNISAGVLRQMTTAFQPEGLLSADGRFRYADPVRLSSVTAPALVLAGDRDFMCPPEGCRKSWQMLGSRPKRFVCLGPEAGCGSHYGHFDLLMGRRAESEVFPLISAHLDAHDGLTSKL